MCGIAGIASFADGISPELAGIRRMCDAMRYRGPDDEGIEVRDRVGLGMRRLSIIDLSGGHQPIYNEDESIRVVFNGEIYNFPELRAKLEAQGHRFRTRSDTEVIVHAYEEYGDDFPAHLNGMFAFALHDLKRQRLVLARDHVGIKPLYYAFDRRHLVWGSEVKVVLASNLVRCSLDHDALREFLCWEYVPEERTLQKEIRKLKPGHRLVVDLRRPACEQRRFWHFPAVGEQTQVTQQDWIERIDAQVQRSVKMQMISDVPLGAFLSGGVDSSLVLASMGKAHAFSIGFDDPTYNELPWSKRVAEHLGLQHTTEIIQPDIRGLFDQLMPHLDDPIGDFSIFPTFLVSRLARQHVTVCLSGDGGDELFGGYETYLAQRIGSRVPTFVRRLATLERRLPPSPAKKGMINNLKRFLEGLGHDASLGHARWRLFLSETAAAELLTRDLVRNLERPMGSHILTAIGGSNALTGLNRALYVDFTTYLPDNILTKVDRMSMAVSLEARVPLLDKDLVELAFQVPVGFKLEGRELKSILKRTVARRVPAECIYRTKQGFSIPIKHWLKTTLKDLMLDLLAESRLRRQGFFDVSTVQRLIREHLDGTHNHSHILWCLMVFEQWHAAWMEN